MFMLDEEGVKIIKYLFKADVKYGRFVLKGLYDI